MSDPNEILLSREVTTLYILQRATKFGGWMDVTDPRSLERCQSAAQTQRDILGDDVALRLVQVSTMVRHTDRTDLL